MIKILLKEANMNKYLKEIVKVGYELLYKIFRVFPVKKNRIIFESFYGKNISCNPKEILDYMIKNNYDCEYIVVYNKKVNENYEKYKVNFVKVRTIKYFYYYATSKVWVVNTNHMILMKPKKNQIYLQTWHAAGAFKRFGKFVMGSKKLEKMRWIKDAQYWTYLLCSSEKVKHIYAESFNISDEKIICSGIPRNDVFLDEYKKINAREKLNNKISNVDDKKIILYAPTFRDDKEFELILDFEKIYQKLNNEYKFILKLHPNIKNKIEIESKYKEFIYDYSQYENTQELLLASDVLITDYSSIIFDFAITGNPIIFYSYDLEEYDNSIRGFYYNYEEFVPGPIVKNDDDLINILENYSKLKAESSKTVLKFASDYNKNSNEKCIQNIIKIIEGELK